MTSIDRINNQIEIDRKALSESDGATREAVRAHLVETLATVCRMTGREGMEEVN